MPTLQVTTGSDQNVLLSSLATFASGNGWTIDSSASYSTTYWRVHMHKGAAHFDLYSSNSSYIYVYACTGWNSGAAPSAQPGASSQIILTGGVSGVSAYRFYSTATALYVCCIAPGGTTVQWCAFGVGVTIIGTWTGGPYITTSGGTQLPYLSDGAAATVILYKDGAWTPATLPGSVCGSNQADLELATRQAIEYNAGLVPLPVLLFLRDATTPTLLRPLAYVPNVLRCNVSDIFAEHESVTIGADTYTVVPQQPHLGVGVNDILLKLGA